MPKSYTIGTTHFPTKTALTAHIQALVARYQDGQTIAGADEDFVRALLHTHPNHAAKVGSGISRLTVRTVTNHGHRTRCFWIDRTDGTRTDFSWHACLTPPSPAQDARRAFRDALGPQLADFKARRLAAGPVTCPHTGAALTLSNAHADHVAPNTFKALLDRFLDIEGLSDHEVAVEPTTDGTVTNRLQDKDLESRWLTYHYKYAKLELLSRIANLSHAKLIALQKQRKLARMRALAQHH
jgi:hypothetical protein